MFGDKGLPEETPESGGETEAPEEEPAEQPEPKRWAGEHETPEDLEQAYLGLKGKLGEQGLELGELRKLREEFEQFRHQTTTQPQSQTFDEDTYEDLLDENPQQALAYAIQAGDGYRQAQALKAWFDVDAFSATEWRLDQERQRQAAQFQQQLSRYEQEVGNQQLTRAFNNVASRHSDFNVVEAKMSELATTRPDLIERLAQPGEQGKEQVIESLYYMARGMVAADTPVEPTGAAPQEAPHVATGQTVPQGRSTPRNPLLESLAREAEEQVLPWNR